MNQEYPQEIAKKVLIVEDELIIAKGIEKRLATLGYSVVDTVPTGDEAIRSARENIPDLVLMDICLTGEMDGIAAADRIRSETGIPVIYLTAYADADTLARAKITEPFGFIVKPFQDGTLKSCIEMALYKHKMESRLKRSEQWLSTILNSIADAVIATDDRRAVTFMNPVAERLTGWKSGEAAGRDISEVFRIRVDGAVPSDSQWNKVLLNGRGVTPFGRIILDARDGREIPIEAKASPFAVGNGKEGGISLAFLDISERIRTEEALRRSERLLSVKNQIANIFLTVADEDMYGEVLRVIQEIMESHYGLFGYIDDAGNLLLPSLSSLVWSECRVHEKSIVFPRESWGGLWGRALVERKSFFSNDAFHVPDGHVSIENFLTVPILYRDRAIGIIAVANREGGYDAGHQEQLESISARISPILEARLQRDREERERQAVEEALASEKERLAVTLRSIGDGVITTDVGGRIVLLNRVAEEITGWRQEEAIGKPFGEVFTIINEKTHLPFESPIERILSSDSLVELEDNTILIDRYGKERVIADSGSPIHDGGGHVVGAALVFRDITEKRRIEQQLLRAHQLESIGVLAGGIAHDFNNLLTAILGNISLAKLLSPKGEKLHQKLLDAENASLRARDLTQQLLTFSRGGAPVRKTADIKDIIRDSATFSLSGSRTTCCFDFEKKLWPMEVDAGQISQVINNLIINARQAMPDGGVIEVSCRNTIVEADDVLPLTEGRYVVITIRDHGTGIPGENIPRIFDPYFTTKPKGKGLGLATVYSIIKNHEGHIAVSSSPGEGTTFSIYLPCCDTSEMPTKTDASLPPEKSSTQPGGRFLVMDDEENIREVAGEMLDFLGYDVDFAVDGEEAVSLYRKSLASARPYAAVLMDLTIPGKMGGKEAMRIIMDMDAAVKGIASSGYSNDPIMSDYRAFGFRGIITKPYQLDDFRKVVEEVLAED